MVHLPIMLIASTLTLRAVSVLSVPIGHDGHSITVEGAPDQTVGALVVSNVATMSTPPRMDDSKSLPSTSMTSKEEFDGDSLGPNNYSAEKIKLVRAGLKRVPSLTMEFNRELLSINPIGPTSAPTDAQFTELEVWLAIANLDTTKMTDGERIKFLEGPGYGYLDATRRKELEEITSEYRPGKILSSKSQRDLVGLAVLADMKIQNGIPPSEFEQGTFLLSVPFVALGF
ncbi:hypothetical protein EV360DRAFT_66456 [Lentinula raphanica]|nr:hypothetical protein EV360DRAFT_66456 [Lentinula raphanica]